MFQRIIAAFTSIMMMLGMAMPMAASAQAFNPGSLIKGQSFSAVYYFAEDGKRYVFPNEKTYFTWFNNFDNIITVDDATLGTIPIGGNVTYRPGKKMVKITTDPKTYVVDRGGVLRHVGSEQLAETLYGLNWNNQIDDIPDPFFINYKIGTPIATAGEYKPADVMTLTTTISQDKNFDETMAAISIGNTMTGFVPSSMTIKKGTTVTWTNQDSATHKVVGEGFQSPDLGYKDAYDRTFNSVGSFEFHDGLNESVVGNITVVE